MLEAVDVLSASILIVDDQQANIMLLERLLRDAGYLHITSTMDSRAVCPLHLAHRYDLILLDLQMPKMDGFKVMEGLKEIEAGDYLSVLVVTAQPGHKLRALQAGAKDFVSKPFDLTEVKTRIHNMLEVRLLYQRLNLMAKVFTATSEGIMITDAQNRIIATNDSFTRLTGYSQAEVVLKDPKILASEITGKETYREMWASIAETGAWEGELWGRRKAGDSYPKMLSINVVRDRDGRAVNYIGNFTDITERKISEEKVLYLAYHDALTKLPNRLSLQERAAQAINLAKRNGTQLAFMLVDLDRFKAINDTFGHHFGDQLLIQVASRLIQSARETDIVARLGGDEFAVLLTGIETPEDAAKVAEKLVQEISAPLLIEGTEVRASPSIGVCMYPNDAQDVIGLIKNSDVAMYYAKAMGRCNYQFFTATLNKVALERQGNFVKTASGGLPSAAQCDSDGI